MPGDLPFRRPARTRLAVVLALSASFIVAAISAPAPSNASSNDPEVLHQRQSQLSHHLSTSRATLEEISQQLYRARGRIDSAIGELATARARLDDLQYQVQQATIRDQQLQQALDAALQRLADAKADLLRSRQSISQQRSDLAAYAVSSSEAKITQLSTLNLLLNADSATAAISQVQTAQSASDKQLMDLQRLQANQVLLQLTEDRLQRASNQVAAARRAAAEELATKQRLESEAASAESDVAAKVVSLRSERDRLERAKSRERAHIRSMEQWRTTLETRLKHIAEVRAAKARREAARREAARRAAEQRAAEQRAAEQRAEQQHSSSSGLPDGGYLSYPVTNTYVTSPYGMRLHPILHIWKLHDGTDFHAPCGTPVHAAASGKVMWEYYAGGYGNQLAIDHGVVHGVSLATSYNHLTSFVAHVGQYVQRGQLIAYSGTTGYSTACHLHFMVYVNGSTVNPMTWL